MAPKKRNTLPSNSAELCNQDFARIHKLLHETITYIEARANRILTGVDEADAEKNLDQLIGMLTKVAALTTKLLPAETPDSKAIVEEDSANTQEINLAMLEQYLTRKRKKDPT